MAKSTKKTYKPSKTGKLKPVFRMADGGNVSELNYSERTQYIEENYAPFITDAQMIFSIWDSGIEYNYKADRKEVVNSIIEQYIGLGDYTETTLPQETIYEIQDWNLVRRDIDPETDEVIGETELELITSDNTYNFSYNGLVDLNWRVYHDEEFERYFYVITPHLGGDIRGNYGDAIILEGNDKDELFYRFYEGFISGGASIYFKFKDGSEIGFDSEQDSDVFYFRVSESFEPTGMALKYLNDFEKFDSWKGDEFLEETIDIYLARKGVAPKMMAGGSLNDETPMAYIQVLGYDEGKWFNITDYSDGQDVIDGIADWMNDLNEEFGGNREEYEVTDYEGFGDDLYDEYMGANEFDEIIEAYEKYENSDFPVDVITSFKSDSGYSNNTLSEIIDRMDDNFLGKYESLSDFGYEMVNQGVYTPSDNDVYITDTDKRILAGEEADFIVDDMRFDDLLNIAVDVKSEYEDEKSELEDKITELESEIQDLTSLQESSDDDDEYETISQQIEEKEIELDEVQLELDDIDNRFEDKAREEARDLFYDEVKDRLENDLTSWLSEHGYEDDLQNINFLSVDYEKIGEEISSDYLIVEYDGDLYFFHNYEKGGRIMASKRKPKYDFYIVESSTKKLVSGYSSKEEAIEQRKLLVKEYPSLRFEIYTLGNLEAKTNLDVYAKKDYVQLSTLDKIKKVSIDAYRYGEEKVEQANQFLKKHDVKGKIKRGVRSAWDKSKQGGNWLKRQWQEADFGDGKGKAKYFADGGGVDLKVKDLKKGDRLKKKGSNIEVVVLEVGNDWRSGYDYAMIESPFGGKPSSYIDVSNFVMAESNSKAKYRDDEEEIEQISEKDFVNRRTFKIGNTLIELEKLEKPTYYRANYTNLEDKEKIGSYGSPIIEDVIFDIKSEKNKLADGGMAGLGNVSGMLPNPLPMSTIRPMANGGGVEYPTKLNIGSVIQGVGFTMLKGLEGGKFYKIVDKDGYSATLIESDEKGKIKKTKKLFRHYLDDLEGGISSVSKGNENGFLVIRYADGGETIQYVPVQAVPQQPVQYVPVQQVQQQPLNPQMGNIDVNSALQFVKQNPQILALLRNGGSVQDEIIYIDNRIRNLEELVVVLNEEDKPEMYATINKLKKEKEKLENKKKNPQEVEEKKSFFSFFEKGGQIALPKDNSKVRFTDDQNREYDGRFIEDENMFYIGFEDRGDFRYSFEVIEWNYLDGANDDDTHVKHEASETKEEETFEHKNDDAHAKHEASETAQEEKAEHEYDVYDNKRMLENQANEIEHHSKELNNQVEITKKVPAWVIAKMERATTDLSDITHYLDGENKMADGGELDNGRYYEVIPYKNKFAVAKTIYREEPTKYDKYNRVRTREYVYGFDSNVLEFDDINSAKNFIKEIKEKYPYGVPKANAGMLLIASELLKQKQQQPQVVYYIPRPIEEIEEHKGIKQDIPEMAYGGELDNTELNDFCITNLIELANEIQPVRYFITDRFNETDIKSNTYKGKLVIVFKEPASVNVIDSINNFIERAEDCHNVLEQSVNVSGSEPRSVSINILSDKFSDREFNNGGKVYEYPPKKINLDKTKKIKTHLGDYNLGLITNDFVYFVNSKEDDENAQTIMYSKNGELLSDNIHATNDFFNVLETEENFEFIHPEMEVYRKEMLKRN